MFPPPSSDQVLQKRDLRDFVYYFTAYDVLYHIRRLYAMVTTTLGRVGRWMFGSAKMPQVTL